VERLGGPVGGDALDHGAAVSHRIVVKAELQVGAGVLVLEQEQSLLDVGAGSLQASEACALVRPLSIARCGHLLERHV